MKLRGWRADSDPGPDPADRKSTRLNSSHGYTSYAVLCLKKKTPPERPRSSRNVDHLVLSVWPLFTWHDRMPLWAHGQPFILRLQRHSRREPNYREGATT